MQHQIHFGKKFYLDKKTGYWISTTCPKIRAHVWVWINHNGPIPEKYHIHHIDEDKSNNTVDNLKCVSSSEHVLIHITEEQRQRSREWANIIRPLAKKWHASKEGIEWHKKHAQDFSFGKWEPISYVCAFCEKNYTSTKKSNSRFCTNKCKSAWRRHQGIDDIDVVCEKCKKIFRKNKYAKNRFCSRECGRNWGQSKINS